MGIETRDRFTVNRIRSSYYGRIGGRMKADDKSSNKVPKPSHRIKMVQTARSTAQAFGVPDAKVCDIYRRLISVAMLYPRYSVICEVFLNDARFTEMEHYLGLFLLGKAKGVIAMLKRTNLTLKYNTPEMPFEAKLISYLHKKAKIEATPLSLQ